MYRSSPKLTLAEGWVGGTGAADTANQEREAVINLCPKLDQSISP